MEWVHKSKEILGAWYTKKGYVKGATTPFKDVYPDYVEYIMFPIGFTAYDK